MKIPAVLVIVALSFSHALAAEARVTPVGKVIEMLQGMLAKGKEEKEAEEAAFAAFDQWCRDTDMTKSRDIKDANAQIEQLQADIQKYESDISTLTKEIEALDGDIATWEGDKKALTGMRRQENSDYEAAHTDYSESIDALERAINILKQQDYKRAQASLVQISNMPLVPQHAKRVIAAFLAQDPEDGGYLDYQAPESAAYEFQSGGVVDMLVKLKNKFEDELHQLEKEETNARHAFEMMAQDLDNQIETATDNRNQKSEAKANKEQANADAKGQLEDTTASRDADQKYLDEARANCATKTAEFEARQKLRQEELDAIAQAIEILTNAVRGLAEKHLPTLVQTSFVQIDVISLQRRVAQFLAAKGHQINSRVLVQLAARAQDDPFKKVKKMIQDLITRLLEEANQEAEHKGWCDTELATNEQTRKQKTDEIDSLTAKIDQLQADINQLAQEIADLNQGIAEIDAAVSQATDQRQKEHATNTETIKDAKDAQAAVAQAMTILKEFYAGAADATALLQNKYVPTAADDAPETWSQAYQGMQAASGGVLGMLEVIQSDFARLEAETTADEEQAASEFKEFIQTSALDKLAKSKDVEHKTYVKEQKEAAHATAVQDREGAQKELDAALAYYEKLKPSCVDAGVSYDDRVARRKEEIESLQEALRILEGEDFEATAFLQVRH